MKYLLDVIITVVGATAIALAYLPERKKNKSKPRDMEGDDSYHPAQLEIEDYINTTKR